MINIGVHNNQWIKHEYNKPMAWIFESYWKYDGEYYYVIHYYFRSKKKLFS